MIVIVAVAVLAVIVAHAASRTPVGEHERTAALTAMAELKAAFTTADEANRDGLARIVAAVDR